MPRTLTKSEWYAEGVRRFGPDETTWAFVCPACGHRQTVADYEAAGAPEGHVAFSCVGRAFPTCREAFGGKGPGPCNYAGGGLFAINPVTILDDGKKRGPFFEFADPVVARHPKDMSAAALEAGAVEEELRP